MRFIICQHKNVCRLITLKVYRNLFVLQFFSQSMKMKNDFSELFANHFTNDTIAVLVIATIGADDTP